MLTNNHISKLDAQIDEARNSIFQLKKEKNSFVINKKKIGGIDAPKENDKNLHKMIDILENRLNKLNIRLNETRNHNKHVKHSIDRVRQNRLTYLELHERVRLT